VADFSVNILLKANDQATPVIRGLVGQARGLNNAFAGGGARRGQGFFGAANLSSAAAGVQQLTGLAKGVLGAPLELAANFEQAMTEVRAVTSDAQIGRNFEELTKKAEALGGSTEFTAQEVASGLKFMGLAGFDTAKQLETISPLLDAATVSGAGLGVTSDIVTDVMSGFGLEARQAGAAIDSMTATTLNANTNFTQLGRGLFKVAPLAKKLGIDLNTANTALGVLASAGIKGAEGGTVLRNVLLGIAGGTKDLNEELQKVGLSESEANNVIQGLDFPALRKALDEQGLEGALGELEERFSALPETLQLAGAQAIFGKRTAAGATELLGKLSTGYVELNEKVVDSEGVARKTAETYRETAKGSATELKSALEQTGIVIGQQLLPVMLPLMEDAKEAAREFAKWAKENPELARTLGKVLIGVVAVGTVLGPVLLALSSFGSLISLGSSLVGGFGAAGLAAAGPYVALAAAAVALGLAIADLIDDMGRLNVEQATLNQLQREGLSIQIGLAKIRGATLLGDLSEADQERLEKLKAKKEKLATELQNVSGTKEFLLGSDAAFFGLEIGDRGSDAIFEDLSKVDAEIDQLNKKGLEAGERRRALEAAGGTTSLEKQLLAGGTAGQVDTATLQDTRAAINQAKAAIDALETNQERVDVGGAIDIRVTQEGGVKVSKRKEGAVPIRVDAGPTLEGG
jgi:TP901 family phage tail tape measure protein